MTKPQNVQFGDQPPKNPEVQIGVQPEAEETVVTIAGDSEPHRGDADNAENPPSDATTAQGEPEEADPSPNPSDDPDPATDAHTD